MGRVVFANGFFTRFGDGSDALPPATAHNATHSATQYYALHHVLDARPLTPSLSPIPAPQTTASKHMGSRRRSSRNGGGHDGGDAAGDEDEGYQPELLDEDEQATLIAELRRKGEEQSRSTRVSGLGWVEGRREGRGHKGAVVVLHVRARRGDDTPSRAAFAPSTAINLLGCSRRA